MAYLFTELPPEEVGEPFPCIAAMHWPGYETKILERRLDGRDIVIQLWKGFCPSYMPGLVGGVGAEVGIYHKGWQPHMWWPDHQHEKKISFKLIYPNSTKVFFSASQQKCWWRHKWMTDASYLIYRASNPGAPVQINTPTFRLKFKIVGRTNTISGTW
jgi:hypothetical protein